MARDKEPFSIFGTIKNAVALVIGAPIAAAASVIVGTLAAVAEGANIVAAGFVKTAPWLRTLVKNPATEALSQACQDAFEKMWTRFGISGYLAAGQALHDTTKEAIKSTENPKADEPSLLETKETELSGVKIKEAANLNKESQNINCSTLPDMSPKPISGAQLGGGSAALGASSSGGGTGSCSSSSSPSTGRKKKGWFSR